MTVVTDYKSFFRLVWKVTFSGELIWQQVGAGKFVSGVGELFDYHAELEEFDIDIYFRHWDHRLYFGFEVEEEGTRDYNIMTTDPYVFAGNLEYSEDRMLFTYLLIRRQWLKVNDADLFRWEYESSPRDWWDRVIPIRSDPVLLFPGT